MKLKRLVTSAPIDALAAYSSPLASPLRYVRLTVRPAPRFFVRRGRVLPSRNEVADTARGLACVLLVVWHVVGHGPFVGLRVGSDSYWRLFVDLFIYFRMPMFAFLAGYFYAKISLSPENFWYFIIGKARRLLLPMLVVGATFVLVQLFVFKNANGVDWVTQHILFPGPYWFLQSLFIVFLLVAVLELLGWLNNGVYFALVVAAGVAIYLTVDMPKFFGLGGAVFLFPYFLFGLAYRRSQIESSGFFFTALAVFVLGYAYAAAGLLGYVPASAPMSPAALIIGSIGPFILLRSGCKQRALMYIGSYSYAIYLFHIFFSGATQKIMYALNVQSITALVILGTLAGVFGPVLIAIIADIFPLTRTMFLGERWAGNPQRAAKLAPAN